jgi:hypothetical protein
VEARHAAETASSPERRERRECVVCMTTTLPASAPSDNTAFLPHGKRASPERSAR